MFNTDELINIKRGLIIAMQSSDHKSMKILFDDLEKILDKIDTKLDLQGPKVNFTK